MRKTVLNLFIVLCLLLVPFLKNYKISVKASDNVTTWHVPGDFKTIQAAINNYTHVNDGDIIYVHVGTYYENVVINRTISLIGENKSTTIVDGGGTDNVISISKANNVSVRDFTLRKGVTYAGIFVDHSMGSDISDNIIIDNSEGIRLDYSIGNIIRGNIISSNDDGISLYSSSDNIVSNNTISSNEYYGIYFDSSGKNLISRNFISYNDLIGISMSYASDNNVSGNTIYSNNPYGISIYYSNNNTIYHNNINNIDQVFSLGVDTNFWEYNDEGNHWSDYTGVDLFSGPYQNESGSDGIGDSTYTIDENNQDKHPLMGTFHDFEAILEREEYHVTIISNSTISGFRFEIGAETGNKMLRFNVTGQEGSIGFSRVTIPTELMEYPHFVLVDGAEVVPRLLNVSDITNFCLYFTYINNNNTVSIISSKTLQLYYELLAEYSDLLQDFYDLNETYYELLDNYTKLQTDLYSLNETYYELSAKYIVLEQSFYDLNKTYYELNNTYYELNETYYELWDMHSELQQSLNNLNNTYNDLLSDNLELQKQFSDLNKTHYSLLINYTNLQIDLHNLNSTYNSLWNAYVTLFGNYSSLLESFEAMNASYQEHLFEFSEQMQNLQNLIYIFAAVTAIFIMTTIYLSKHAHVRLTKRNRELKAER